jgi:excisionase family DNA binding protein
MSSLWDIDDVAAYLKMPKSTIYKLTSKGLIPHKKIGNHLRFDPEEIREWLDLKTISPMATLRRARKAS